MVHQSQQCVQNVVMIMKSVHVFDKCNKLEMQTIFPFPLTVFHDQMVNPIPYKVCLGYSLLHEEVFP